MIQDTEWVSKGDFISLLGNNIFYIDHNPQAEHSVCYLHGYPTSSHDLKWVLPYCPQNIRIIALDFLGFGLSAKPTNHSYLLTHQADIVIHLLEYLKIYSIHIFAHNYGTSVATELCARNNNGSLSFKIKSMTLSNGSMLIHMSQLRTIQKLLKNKITGPIVAFLSNRNTFHRNMRKIWHDSALYNRKDMEVSWEMITLNNGKKVLPVITRYINQRYENYDRWIGALKHTEIPCHILWADNDPVAIVQMAFKLEGIISINTTTIIKNCGHYPMIEKAKEWSEYAFKYILKNEKVNQ